jgi:hypothetical protein
MTRDAAQLLAVIREITKSLYVAEVEESLKSFRNTMTGENLFSNV